MLSPRDDPNHKALTAIWRRLSPTAQQRLLAYAAFLLSQEPSKRK